MDKYQARLLPIHLICTPEVQATRVVQPDRTARGKLDQVSGLDHYMAKNDYAPLPLDNCLTVDTTDLQPTDIAHQIVAHFDLHRTAP